MEVEFTIFHCFTSTGAQNSRNYQICVSFLDAPILFTLSYFTKLYLLSSKNLLKLLYYLLLTNLFYIQPNKALLTLNVGRSGIPVPVTRRKKSLPPSRDRSYERSSPISSPRRPFRAPSHAPSRGPSRSRNLTRSTSETPPTRLPPISRF